ncbi:Rec8 like protein-domain-containing protein [Lyophyllum atratum]|nr:Rec8 like protein-domain-containing protein [Lyophyllum atratum]
MFFSAELLASRDSGFGLLWLAATLGSKSTFKKLPKRSILTADIAQLCDLIAEPSEPLALRLSSNLLVGVARVYKVKQEMFMSDVTSCFTSLKKVVHESQCAAVMDARLQMPQASVRPSAVTLVANPRAAIAMDFDAFVADWDAYLNIGANSLRNEDSQDDDFDPKDQAKNKTKPKVAPHSQAENARAELHTLTEHHDHLLSASFDLSYHGSGNGAPEPSSSQAADYAFDDNCFAPSDGLDVGELADELAQELGWGSPPNEDGQLAGLIVEEGDLGFDLDLNFGIEQTALDQPVTDAELDVLGKASSSLKRKAGSCSDKENHVNPSAFQSPALTPLRGLGYGTSFSQLLLSQDEQPIVALNNITQEEQSRTNAGIKRMKKTRLLLDARTELTDEELKAARAQYLQTQNFLRCEIENKQSEKNCGRSLEEKVWSVPCCIHAPVLVDFWQENFKVQVEARTGSLHIHPRDDPPRKRQKVKGGYQMDLDPIGEEMMPGPFEQNDMAMDIGGATDIEFQNHFRSSEEPGQGRRLSRATSILGDLSLDLGTRNMEFGSQKSSLFPWDNAGGSSSSGMYGPGMPGSDTNLHVDHVEIRLRGSSRSRRDSSLVPSQMGSLAGGPGFSPALVPRESQVLGEDYAFDVDMQEQPATLESQRSDMNLISLERNSFNFLEYAKMQSYSLPPSTASLTFDIVVPQSTSTRHVAASAFYHCLVLATKDLLRLKQTDPHGQLLITVI